MKFVQEYCSICKKSIAMPVVQEEESHPDLIWIRCPECNEIKPVEARPEDLKSESEAKPGSRPRKPAEEPEPKKRVVRHYRSGERFIKGEWIYHPEWQDTGQVVEKCRSRGGHDVIVVDFERQGKKRLVSRFIS
ncbi:MAG: hypothetical protein R6V10_07940 [bacterium]